MSTISTVLPRPSTQLGIGKTLLLALPMILVTTLMMSGGGALPDDPLLLAAYAITWAGINILFILMLRTGKTDRFRAVLFVGLALAMIPTFSNIIISERGSVALTTEDMINGRTPFCHLVIPMILGPAALIGTIIFPGSLTTGFASIGSMVVLWLGASLVMGRGFCAWGCFYGGLDEGSARIGGLVRALNKIPFVRRLRTQGIDRRWTLFPYAMLVFIVLASALTLSPTYCEWFCPFKAVTEYPAVTNLLTLIQMIIFLVLFAGLVVILPLLTRKRTQCGLFCPFGAFQSLTNKVNLFDIRIDPEKCTGCQRCVRECPTYSLDETSLKSGHALISCTKCGKCVDNCPKGAISFHVKGTHPGSRPNLARVLFLYPAFLFLATFGSGTITMALWVGLKLVFGQS